MDVLNALAVVAGVLLALAITANIVRALIITRARRTVMFDAVDEGVAFLFRMAARPLPTYERKDQLLAAQGAVVILAQLATWLLGVRSRLRPAPFAPVNDFSTAFREAGSSMFTLGFIYTHGNEPAAIDVIAAATGDDRGGFADRIPAHPLQRLQPPGDGSNPPGCSGWAPAVGTELLLRTRYGVAVRVDDLPAFYNRWERWAADVAESHSNYPVLVRFRSPHPLDSWLVGLLSVMDSAAMLLALRPSQDRIEPRRAIRMGFTALREIGGALGMARRHGPRP